jgi:hypothetical protein
MFIKGWFGRADADDDFEVRLDAKVYGTVTDTSGNTYRITGYFTERSIRNFLTHPIDLLFRGEGHMTISGPGGTYAGRATAAAVDGPPERGLDFTDMNACRTR